MTTNVSVLIPTYNRGTMVGRAIRSAMAQTYRDIEILVSDNASNDNTDEVVEGLRKEDARVVYLKQTTNVGPVQNWVRIAGESEAPLVALLFSDDWYHPEFLAHLVSAMKDPSVGFAFSAVNRVDETAGHSRCLSYFGDQRGITTFTSDEFLDRHLGVGGLPVPQSPGCALFRREDLRQALSEHRPYFEPCQVLRHGAGIDLLVFLTAAIRHPRFAYMSAPLANFRAHGANLSRLGLTDVSYFLARCDFYDRFRPRVDYRSHQTMRSWGLLSLHQPLRIVGLYPEVDWAAVRWSMLLGRLARRAGSHLWKAMPGTVARNEESK